MRRNLLLSYSGGGESVCRQELTASHDHRSSCTDSDSSDVARAIFPNRCVASSGGDSAGTCWTRGLFNVSVAYLARVRCVFSTVD